MEDVLFAKPALRCVKLRSRSKTCMRNACDSLAANRTPHSRRLGHHGCGF
ncbi:hypothetical protein [Mycetohabitans rhizoxinica]